MYRSVFILTFLVNFCLISISCASSLNNNNNIEDVGGNYRLIYASEEELPEKFRIPYEKIKDVPPVNLDKITFLEDRNNDFFEAWSPSNLEKKGYFIVQGSRFLNYSKKYC